MHELVYLAFFSLQLTNIINNFELILAAREKKHKRWFVKCFYNVIYFGGLEILHCSSLLPFLIFIQPLDNLLLTM